MKKLLLSTLISLVSFTVISQSCLPEGITFTTQTQIDSFQIYYPNCTEIEGDLTIYGWYPYAKISNLDSLSVLINIGGNFSIMFNDSLTSLTGLENLVSIGGDLVITYNKALGSLTGLENLNLSTIDNVSIHNNDFLTFCEVQNICNWLSSPNGCVNIYNNAVGCNNPSEIASACGYTLPCLPFGNYHLVSQSDINNFENNYPECTEIAGNVEIKGDDIINLQGLNSIKRIEGNLSFYSNDILTDLTGLENLDSIGGNLALGISPSLDMYAFNPNLNSLSGLNNLSFIGGNLSLILNTSLTDLSGLEGLTAISGSLSITFNPLLSNLSGLSNMTTLGGDFKVIGPNALTSLIGMEWLTSVFGDVEIIGNDSLSNLTGLDNLTFIAGHLSIEAGNNMTSLSGLNNLATIGGGLWINSASLSNFSELNNLTSIGELGIIWNDALTSLSGLENIDANSISKLTIRHNHALSACDVQSICNYLAAPNGTIEIHDNALGCNNLVEVEGECGTSVTEIIFANQISIFPNPFTTSTTILYELKQPEKVILTIYDYLGKQVYQTEVNQPQGKQQLIWRAEGYANGIYYYRLQVGDAVANGKMVKVR